MLRTNRRENTRVETPYRDVIRGLNLLFFAPSAAAWMGGGIVTKRELIKALSKYPDDVTVVVDVTFQTVRDVELSFGAPITNEYGDVYFDEYEGENRQDIIVLET